MEGKSGHYEIMFHEMPFVIMLLVKSSESCYKY